MTFEYAQCRETQMQSQNQFIKFFLTLIATLMLGSGCQRSTPTPAPRGTPTPVPLSETSVVPMQTRSITTIQPARVVVPDPKPEPARTPADVVRDFHATNDPERRGELAAELWEINTPEAIATLQQLHAVERDE